MNLRDLTYLVALSEYRHFGKAAEKCCISQPALSMQIKKLEEYLGVQLLERTKKSVLLTEVGKVIAEKAKQILIHAEELKEIANLAKNPYCGKLKIGIIPTLAPYLLPHIMPSLTSSYVELTIYLVEGQSNSIIKQLKEGKLDAIILALPVTDNSFVSMPLFEENFMLAIPKSNPLSTRTLIKQTDLLGKNLLLLEEGHCLRDQALAVCYFAKANESSNFRATSLETLRHMVSNGIGITLIPKLACKPNDGLVYLNFNQPRPSRTIGMLWRTASTKETLLKEIASDIKKTMLKKNFKL